MNNARYAEKDGGASAGTIQASRPMGLKRSDFLPALGGVP